MSDNIFYTRSHEWIEVKGIRARIGITQYAQGELGEIVAVELPKVGEKVEAGKEASVLESTKAAADVYAPISGTVVAVNKALSKEPGLINSSPESDGWLFEVEGFDSKEVTKLFTLAEYQRYLKE
ncbi:MAG TPA: glycine cleavage system protein GcvH [Chlamydiales bacterium]|nr:glycine cleavage system protein GcvH [Chlamydiales bacterium]